MTAIQQQLFALQDVSYQAFHSKLIPSVDSGTVIGVRMPALRRLAKELYKNGGYEDFMSTLPHTYYEENNLHGLLICQSQDYSRTIDTLEHFLPFVDNWATCDSLRPCAFAIAAKRDPDRLLSDIHHWMSSDEPYIIRFGIEMLMVFFLDGPANFRLEHLDSVANIQNEHYYVRMMVAWFFATALAKQYESTIPYLENHVLPDWTHRKTIQKAIESFRITPEQKSYLRTLV